MNPEYIYADAEEKYVLGVVLYGNASKLYLDAAHTAEADHDFVLNACMKGIVRIFNTDTYYGVASFKDDDGTLTVTDTKATSANTYTVTAAEA